MRAVVNACITVAASLLIGATLSPISVQAQGLATLCIGVYLDANGNGARDADEVGLPDINLSLSVPPGVIVTNYVTETSAPHCFEALPTGIEYTLTINSPEYVPANADSVIFTPQPDEQIAREFPLVERPPEAPTNGIFAIPLTMQSRLILASICALVAMAFVGALGLLIYGLFLYPRQPKATERESKTATQQMRSVDPWR